MAKKSEASKTLCPLPWIHLSANTDGSLRVCCNTAGEGIFTNRRGKRVYLSQIDHPKKALNHSFLRKVRREMLAGKKPFTCTKCYSIEEKGGHSLRQVYLKLWKKELQEKIEETSWRGAVKPEVLYLDFALGNLCNLQCRMCAPMFSQKMVSEFEELNISFDKEQTHLARTQWKLNDRFRSLMDRVFNHVEEMLFTGGEPFLSRQHFYILEQLIQRGLAQKVSLRYHSNLTHLPDQLLEHWSHFKSVQINCSIEAVGELNNYIRYPSKWQDVDANIRKVLSLKSQVPVYMEFHTVFQALSILRVTELMDYLSQFKDQAAVFPYFISMDYPEALRVEALPAAVRKETKIKILNYIKEREDLYFTGEYGPVNKERFKLFESCWEMLNTGEQKKFEKKFIEWNAKMDKFRNQSLQNVLPEIEKIYPKHP